MQILKDFKSCVLEVAEAARQVAREERRAKIVHDRDLGLENDLVLAKMIQVGAKLDLATYIAFTFFGTPPEGIEEDAEFLASVPDVILNGPRKIQ
jgi:hypothetical protein